MIFKLSESGRGTDWETFASRLSWGYGLENQGEALTTHLKQGIHKGLKSFIEILIDRTCVCCLYPVDGHASRRKVGIFISHSTHWQYTVNQNLGK